MNSGFAIEAGKYGRRAVLRTAWSEDIAVALRKENIVELELNSGKGWYGGDVSFLAMFPNLLSLEILSNGIESSREISELHQLRKLKLITYCRTPVEFASLPRLETCSLQWRPKARAVFDCVTLMNLFIDGYKGKGTEQFGRLVNLEHLQILNSPIDDLGGLAKLADLKTLRLGGLRCLSSLAGLGGLAKLEELWVQTCKRIRTLDELGTLGNLQRVQIDNCGEIASLKPLEAIASLEMVSFVESTNILDGDLTPLIRQPSLSNVSFQNRRHYSHRREEFKGYGTEGTL